ncbi:MAG: phosphate signaling complex protein PhoU [Burkholderiaceae bacterium]
MTALAQARLSLAHEVIRREATVDRLELRLDDDVWWEVGRRNPVARDLRAVMAFSKAVADLERIGDEAARIAHVAVDIYGSDRARPDPALLRDVATMGHLAVGMLREAVRLFDSLDAPEARKVLERNTDLDAEFRSSLRRLSTFVLEDARNIGHAVNAVVVLKSLERIGEHARGLAQYVIYLVRGEDVRHSTMTPGAEPEDGGADPGPHDADPDG